VGDSPIIDGDPTDPVRPRAGDRLPHTWLADGRSLYDALGPDHTLLVRTADGSAAARVIGAAFAAAGVPLSTVDLTGRGSAPAPGLLLVRPDQHVAWRGDAAPADPGALADLVSGRAR
jgi:hypothetical protein